MLKSTASNHNIAEIIDHIKRRTYVSRDKFNRDPCILPVKNGLLNIKTDQLGQFTPEKIYTYSIPVFYDPDAECPRIWKFLSEVVSKKDQRLIKQILGYALFPSYVYHRIFWFYGLGRNGKTTLVKLLEALLGTHNCSAQSLESLACDRFSVARLYGKLLNVCSEPKAGRMLETETIKKLTGGDSVDGETKGVQETIRFVNFAKIVIIGNKFPEVWDRSKGWSERNIVVNFSNEFIGTKKDAYLLEKLTTSEELSGFLNYCLEGLRDLEASGDFDAGKQNEIQLEFYKDNDSIRAFYEECIVLRPGATLTKAELYTFYRAYCKQQGLFSESEKMFGQHFKTMKGVSDRKLRAGWIWVGVALRTTRTRDTSAECDTSPYCLPMEENRE